MRCVRIVVGYFPDRNTGYIKQVSSNERVAYWKEKWGAEGAIVRAGLSYYQENKQYAYESLKKKLIKEIQNAGKN